MAKRVYIWIVTALLVAAPAVAQQPAGGQTEFVPASSLPPAEQLPAAPLLIAAYAFVWVAVFVYIWSVWRRLGRVEAEMNALEKRMGHRSNGATR
jgi:CcmD family protein